MRRLSCWAKNNKAQARIIIVLSFVLLTGIGIATGILLKDIGVSFSSTPLLAVIVAYCIGIVAYPSKLLKGNKLNAAAFYIRQKTCDLLLVASTFCMIMYIANRPEKLFAYSDMVNAAIPAAGTFPTDSTVKMYKAIDAFRASLKDENGKSLKWKEKKRLLKEQVRAIKKSGDLSPAAKVGLIILSVLVAMGLFYLVAALACNLSCGGSEGAATLVLLAGTGLIIVLLILAIRAIVGRKGTHKGGGIKAKNP